MATNDPFGTAAYNKKFGLEPPKYGDGTIKPNTLGTYTGSTLMPTMSAFNKGVDPLAVYAKAGLAAPTGSYSGPNNSWVPTGAAMSDTLGAKEARAAALQAAGLSASDAYTQADQGFWRSATPGDGTVPWTPAAQGDSASYGATATAPPSTTPATFGGNAGAAPVAAPVPQYTSAAQPAQQPARQPNPYLGAQADAIRNQYTRALNEDIMPGIGQGAEMAGGYGGSRMGIAQGKAASSTGLNLASALANMYSTNYQQDQNTDTARMGQSMQYDLGLRGNDTARSGQSMQYDLGLRGNNLGFTNAGMQYDLGLRSNDLGFANLDANIFQNNFANKLAGANLGLNTYNTLQNGNQMGINAGNQIQKTPFDYYNNFANIANGIGQGYGTSSSTNNASGNPLMGALGGAQLASALAKNLGFGVTDSVAPDLLNNPWAFDHAFGGSTF